MLRLSRSSLEFCVLMLMGKKSSKNDYILDHLNGCFMTHKISLSGLQILFDLVGTKLYDFKCHELMKNEQK